jgi:uncharacterized membrane protein SpoIIM required for sporulation
MRERTFVMRRQAGWERLEALLARADRSGLRGLEPSELQNLALLYRATTSDLAAAQSRDYTGGTRDYLNRLTARAHAYVYVDAARPGWSRMATFFGATFPREVRTSWRSVAACTAITVIAAIVAYWLVAQRSLNAYALVPRELIYVIDKPIHDANFGFDRDFSAAMASEIITNNIKVAMLAFAGGLTLGILTFWSILENGLMVGALGALYHAKGFGLDFWATIAPHGVIELSAIQIAGGSGFLLAQALIAPGRLRRIDALKANGRRAATLMLGVAGMLVVAGCIEGFISPQRLSIAIRFSIGAVTAIALVAYIGWAGRARGGRKVLPPTAIALR